jgi:hypothetical protein
MSKLKSNKKLKTEDYVIDCKYSDKKGFKITLELLESLIEKSNSLKKLPLLVLGLKRNENENFLLECTIKIEKK